ncbi:unnamed protein product, partial [Mesorhabditis belari]|uniref:Uncharacterized protein n=1 Tax=Mesorhabditis belari TaxID=2138241 RepID=A0AAF3FQ44_9BILA
MKSSPKVFRRPLQPIPDTFEEFLNLARKFNEDDPLNAFNSISGLKLVGPFEILDGVLDHATDDELRLHWRFPNDLPEMQTCAVFEGGRFCIWRDEPDTNNSFIVTIPGNGDEFFAEITVLGEHPCCMLFHLNASSAFFPKNMKKNDFQDDEKRIKSERIKKRVALPLHGAEGPGIVVPVKNGIGYRPILTPNAHIKHMFLTIATTTNEKEREKLMGSVREMLSLIQMADDEMDFGMGLELGHDCFMANAPRLDKVTKLLLAKAYELLGRKEYGEIVRIQFVDGNRRRENLSILV